MNTQLMIAGYCPVGNYSFEIIYKKYHTFFVHYAEKTMGEELYAEDVVQDVFINLLQQTNYFVSEGAVLKYIYKALYNRCIDLIRHKQIEQHYEEVSGNDFISALNRDGHNTLLTKEFFVIVENRIKGLPPKCKQIFVMKYKNEYSNPEISEKVRIIDTNSRESNIYRPQRVTRICGFLSMFLKKIAKIIFCLSE